MAILAREEVIAFNRKIDDAILCEECAQEHDLGELTPLTKDDFEDGMVVTCDREFEEGDVCDRIILIY
jgi:hypothetical protein